MAVNDVAKMRTSNRIAVRVRSSPSAGADGGGFFCEVSSETDVESEGGTVASEAAEAAALSLLAMEVDATIGRKCPVAFGFSRDSDWRFHFAVKSIFSIFSSADVAQRQPKLFAALDITFFA